MTYTLRSRNYIDTYSRPAMFSLLLIFVVGSLLLEYGESILLGCSVLVLYGIYLYLYAPARQRLVEGLRDARHSRTTLAMVFIPLWSFISAIWSEARLDTLGNSLMYFYLLMLYLAMKYEFNEDHYRKRLFQAFTLAIAGTMGYLVWQYASAYVRHEAIVRDRFISTIENSNNLGIIAMMFFLICASLVRSAVGWKSRFLYGVLALFSLAGILTSQSRSSIVVIGVMLIYIIWKYNPKYILVLALLAMVVVVTPTLQQRVLDIFSYEQNVQRVKVWHVASMLFRENPFFGVGANAFRVGYVRIFEANPQMFNNYDIKVLWHAHNMFLRFAAEQGIPGLASLFLLIGGSVRMMRSITKAQVYRASRSFLMDGVYLAIIAFYLGNILDSYWMSPKPLFVFYFILGLAGGYARHHRLSS